MTAPRILIIDADPLAGASLRAQLRELGLDEAETATTVDDALSLAASIEPAVVLLDVTAPGCLNHKVMGVEGIYDRHDYIDERREALTKWAAFLDCCETGKDWNINPLHGKKTVA